MEQTTDEAIAGELAGTILSTLPAPVTIWARFEADYPEGVVLQPARGGDPAADPREIPARSTSADPGRRG